MPESMELRGQKFEKPYTLEPNIEAALTYFITPLTGFVVLYMEKENKFVRFHAFQSVLFGVATLVLFTLLTSTFLAVIGIFITPLLYLGWVFYWLLLMWKAYNKEEYEIPVLGKIARDQIK